jgi:hypothetical protein
MSKWIKFFENANYLRVALPTEDTERMMRVVDSLVSVSRGYLGLGVVRCETKAQEEQARAVCIREKLDVEKMDGPPAPSSDLAIAQGLITKKAA